MRVSRFEDLIGWQKSQDLAVLIRIKSMYRKFRDQKDFGFKNQICRAAVSISNNIAEGLTYITSTERQNLIEKTTEVGKIIFGLIKSIKNK